MKGELTDEASIEKAVEGADAVISLLGPRGGSTQKPLTRGTQNIVKAMKTSGVRRLIASSTLSVRDTGDKPSPTVSLLVNIIKTTMHTAYQDITGAAETVRGSGLDWTIARVATLNNGPKTGNVRTGHAGTGHVGLSISRADPADFMLKQVEDGKYLRQAPAVSN